MLRLAWSVLLTLACAVAAPGGRAEAADATVTILLVRHAEAGQDDPRNPGLSPAGQERAQELARVLRDVPVTHAFASQYRRTQETVQPVASARQIEVVTHDARDADGLIGQLRRLPGGAIAVVAGHSNTVPDLVQRLGGVPTGLEEHPEHGWLLPHDEYARLYVVTLRRPTDATEAGFENCLELRYGAESASH